MLRCGVVAFARWDPFRDLIAIQHRMDRLSPAGVQGWAPAVDLSETSDAFIIKAELPGLLREQIRIHVHDGRLTLQGRRDTRVPCEHYHQVERGHGEFCRTFALPPAVDAVVELVKAADKLCAYIKCLEEMAAGNKEFTKAEQALERSVRAIDLPEVKYFLDIFVPSFRLTLDELG